MSTIESLKAHRLVYVATPYSKYPGGIERAFIDAARLTAKLMQAGCGVYSPIAHTHPLAIHGGIDPMDHDIWLPFDQTMMDIADAIVVLEMPGWEESRGIAHEIGVFETAGKPVYFIKPEVLLA